MSPQNEDFIFAQEAQAKGYVTEEQVEEGFLLQKRMAEELKIDERLAIILVKRGWMAEEQARRVYALLEPEGRRIRIEGYRLVERVGRGSMGTVYKAIHEGLHRVVAIKVLRRELLGEKVHTERLKNEARMLADLEHPHIVRALDAGESNGFPYVVMEFVEGETLKDRIARVGSLDEDEALRYARGVADALEKARRMGVVHRDVKPGNILISTRGIAKLMDLGLAKGPVDMELTQHGATVGTPQFMAPEQVEEAGAVDSRSDIYGLGATMYAMLTGRPPFTGTSMAEILNRVLNEQAIPIRALTKDVSPEVSYLVERMMLKDPSLRFQTPSEVVNQVDRILGGQSIIPDGFKGNWEGFLLRQRTKRRFKLTMVTCLLVALAASAFFIVRGKNMRATARVSAADLETDIIEAARVERIANQGDLERTIVLLDEKINRLRRLREDAGASGRLPDAVLQARRRLARYRELYDAFSDPRTGHKQRAAQRVRREKFKTAHTGLGQFAATLDADFRALRREVSAERDQIHTASEKEWRDRRKEAWNLSASNLDEYVKRMTALRDVLLYGDFVLLDTSGRLSELDKARTLYKSVVQRLEDVRGLIAAFDKRFDPQEVLAQRVAEWDRVGILRGEMQRVAEGTSRTASGFLKGDGWDAAIPSVRVLDLVGPALDDRLRNFDAFVADEANRELQDVRTFQRAGRLGDALARVEPIVDALGTTYFRTTHAAAAALFKQIQEENHALLATAAAYVQSTAREVLLRLRAGDLVGAQERIRQAIAERPNVDVKQDMKGDLEALHEAPAAVGSVHEAAFRLLSSKGAAPVRTGVLLYDEERRPLPPQRVRIEGVDPDTRRVQVRFAGGGRSFGSPRWVSIERFELAQLVEWTTDSAMPDGHGALCLLVALARESWTGGRDLRPLKARIDTVFNRLNGLQGFEPWTEYASSVQRLLADAQAQREGAAYLVHSAFLKHYAQALYVLALDKGREYLEADAIWHHTVHVDTWGDKVREKLKKCEEEAEKRELERWMRGFRSEEEKQPGAKQPGEGDGKQPVSTGRTRLRCDFDNEICLKQFEHGFARLVSEAGSIVTTPDPTARERRMLELLPGVEGVMPGRPLTLAQMPFDPADRIEVSFLLDTRRGAFFLAVDIDGVQLGVLSADPQWFPSWVLPSSVLFEGEDAMNFYGRGRGIAWHEGTAFGRIAGPPEGTWTWHDRNRGRHHPRWRGMLEGKNELFAFRPGTRYRVKFVRERDRITLYAGDARRYEAARDDATREKVLEKVFSRTDGRWRSRGSVSELAPGEMSKGSGKIQLLSWSTVRIDDLEIAGRVREGWKAERRRVEREAAAKAGK